MTNRASLAVKRGRPIVVSGEPSFSRPDSQLVSASQFYEPEMQKWYKYSSPHLTLDRKKWEYSYILHAIDTYIGLGEGVRGLGFGCGKEHLTSIMAGFGCSILATDYLPPSERIHGWEAQCIDDVFFPQFIAREDFEARVRFRDVDMNEIPEDFRDYAFLWSTGSLEHIGGHANGLAFIEKAMACLKPGGIAVHTTEFTITSPTVSLDRPDLSFYCRRDIEELAVRLINAGHLIVLNFDRGTTVADNHVDIPPYHDGMTLVAHHYSHVITSIGLIIQKDGLL